MQLYERQMREKKAFALRLYDSFSLRQCGSHEGISDSRAQFLIRNNTKQQEKKVSAVFDLDTDVWFMDTIKTVPLPFNTLNRGAQRTQRMQMTKMMLTHVVAVFIKRVQRMRYRTMKRWKANVVDLIKLS